MGYQTKKKLIQILAIVLAVLMVIGLLLVALTSCSPAAKVDPINTTESVTETSNPIMQDFLILHDGVAVASVIRPDLASQEEKDAAIAIRRGIEEITGILPTISDDYLEPGKSPDPEAYEILVGKTNRPESDSVAADFSTYASYSITAVGKKLIVLASDSAGYSAAADYLLFEIASHYTAGAHELSIPAGYSESSVKGSMLSSLPLYQTKGKVEALWDCGDSCSMYIIKNTNESEYTAYTSSLESKGLKKQADNKIGDNLYGTYTSSDGKYLITTVYTAYEKKSRLIVEPIAKGELPLPAEKVEKPIGPVTLTQVGLEYLYNSSKTIQDYQIGMLYIFRLQDGRFILIDGGFNFAKSLNLLMDALKKQAPDPNNITIAAWILTHSHGDHIGVLAQVANDSSAKKILNIERFIFNFPSKEQYEVSNSGYPNNYISYMRSFKDTKLIKAHPGQKYSFGGADIEIYSTHELIAPQNIDTGNTMSMTFAIYAEGQKIMFLGDSSNTMSNTIAKCYGNALKSDIVQVSHHGASGGTVELYKLIDMKVAFWPLGVDDYYYFGGYGRKKEAWNSYFFSSPNMMEIILAGHSERTVTLPYNPTEKSFPPDTFPG